MDVEKTTINVLLSEGESRPSDTSPPEVAGKTKRAWAGKRLVALVAGVAVLSLLAGIALMQFVISPAELAARTEPPEAGPVTALVEERTIENTIVTRGEVTYAGSREVEIDTAESDGRPIITGHVPKVGDLLGAGDIALEVVGRPVVVLKGALPAYRTLSIGMRGPDVLQLKKALDKMGYWAGDTDSDLFEWDTSAAVGALYEEIGYAPATGAEGSHEALRAAEASARSAEIALTRAQNAYNQAARHPEGADLGADALEVEEAEYALSAAYEDLEEAEIGVQPVLPAGEVLFLTSLPRRVDEVYVRRGDTLSGPAMVVSGAKLTIEGTVSQQDADLLEKGMVATYTTASGEEREATITKISAPRSNASSSEGNQDDAPDEGVQTSDRFTVRLNPGKLSKEEISQLRGTNVRLRIPVASTDGVVLAVPLAALSASADGGNRVELLVPEADDPYRVETVQVSPGLAAGGYVEISSDDARIEPGAKVVVGR